MKSRLLSILLALIMVLGLLPISTFAADSSNFVIENGVLTKYTGGEDDVVIPNGIISIGDGAFWNCTMTSVSIPFGVTSIGESAFQNCPNLTSASIPSGVTSIGESAFLKCTSLTSVNIPSSVTDIGKWAFWGCTSLANVSIPSGVTSIGVETFFRCTSLTNVSIPSSVTSIEAGAFRNCTRLTSVSIPSGVTSIEWEAFSGCTRLTSVNIPFGVTTISQRTFSGCTSLTDVYYAGSREDWEEVSILTDNQSLLNATIHYAKSSNISVPDGDAKPELYWATFDARPGKFLASDLTSDLNCHEEGGTLIAPRGADGRYLLEKTPPIPVREGYTFAGWRINFVNGEKDSKLTGQIIKDFTSFDFPADLTFEAEWEKAGPNTPGKIAFEHDSYLVAPNKTLRIKVYLPDVERGTQITTRLSALGILSVDPDSTGLERDDPDSDSAYLTVRGISSGKVKLSLSAEDGRKATCEVTVRTKVPEAASKVLEYDFSGTIAGFSADFILQGEYSLNMAGTIEIRDCRTDQSLYETTVRESNPYCGEGPIEDTTRVSLHLSKSGGFTELCNQKVYFYSEDFIQNKKNGASPDLSDLKEQLTIKMDPDRWSFGNNDHALYSPTMGLSKQYYDYLLKKANSKEQKRFKNAYGKDGKKRDGSCFGLASLTLLKDADKISVGLIASKPVSQTTTLYDLEKKRGDSLESIINYFYYMQYMEPHWDYKEAFMLRPSTERVKVLDELAAIAENGGPPFIIGFGYHEGLKSGYHAIVGYGVEYGAFPSIRFQLPFINEPYERSYDSRVRIYDNNDPDNPHYMYFDSSEGSACIPEYGLCDLRYVYNNFQMLDPQNFLSPTIVGPVQKSTRSRLIVDSQDGKFGFTLALNGKQYHIDETTDERALGLVSYFDDEVPTSGGPRTMYVTLPDTKSACTIVPDSGTNCGYTLYTPDALFSCDAAGVDSIHLTPSGEIQASGAAGTYSCTLCFDEGLKGLPWYSVDVSGTASSDLRIVPQDKGVLISGQKLGDVTLLCENDQVTTSVKLSAQDAVLLTTKSDGKTPIVYQDSDGDGTFETEVDISVSVADTPAQLPDTDTAETAFTDVPTDAYYYDAVVWAVEQGITAGTSATTFSPNASCTRAQMVTFLWRAAGSPAPQGGTDPFVDVQSGTYYYNAVLWAVEQGITAGTSATTFSPNATVTRSQTVTFLWRAAGSPAANGGNPFGDVVSDAYYASAVQWAVDKGVTAGTSATTFSPNDYCTRAQIVTFLYRNRAN